MDKFIEFVKKYRTTILIILIAAVLVNFYIYKTFILSLRTYIKRDLSIYESIFQPFISAETFDIVVVDGSVFFFTSIINTMLSAAVIVVFFNFKQSVIKVGLWLLFLYWGITSSTIIFSYLMDWKKLFITTRAAMDVLSSPLIEASLIPILKLYEQSLEIKAQQEEEPLMASTPPQTDNPKQPVSPEN